MVNDLIGAWGPAIAVFVTVVLATVALAFLAEWVVELQRRRRIAAQLRSLAAGHDILDPTSETLLRSADAVERDWQRLAQRVPQIGRLASLLEQGGMRWTAQTFFLLTLGLAAAAGLAASLVVRNPLAALIAAAAGASLPYLHVRRRRNQRLAAFEEELPEAIDLIGRAIRAGHPLSAGLKMAADEAPEPVSSEFRRVFEEQRFGMPFEDALLGLADRVELVDVRILVTAVLIQRQVGGNLAEVLDKIAYTIRARFTIRRQLRVYTAQGRFSGWVLAILPVAVATALFFISREYVMTLFLDPIARYFLILAIILQGLGYLWIRKIVNIEI